MLIWSVDSQAVFILLCGLMPDLGVFTQICFYSGVAFWAGAAIVMIRRPRHPTRSDIIYFRAGLLLITFADFFIIPFIWSLRGVWSTT